MFIPGVEGGGGGGEESEQPLLHLRTTVLTQVIEGDQPLERSREGQCLDPVRPPSVVAQLVGHSQASQVAQTTHTAGVNLGDGVQQRLLELSVIVQDLFDAVTVQGLEVLEPRHHPRGQEETGHGGQAPEDGVAQGFRPFPAVCGDPLPNQQLDDLLEVGSLVPGELAVELLGRRAGQLQGKAVQHGLEVDLPQVHKGQQLSHDLGAAAVDGQLEDQQVDVLGLGAPGQEKEGGVPALVHRGVDEDDVDDLGVGRPVGVRLHQPPLVQVNVEEHQPLALPGLSAQRRQSEQLAHLKVPGLEPQDVGQTTLQQGHRNLQ